MYVLIHWALEFQGNERHNSSTRVNLAFRITCVAYPQVLLLGLCTMLYVSAVESSYNYIVRKPIC